MAQPAHDNTTLWTYSQRQAMTTQHSRPTLSDRPARCKADLARQILCARHMLEWIGPCPRELCIVGLLRFLLSFTTRQGSHLHTPLSMQCQCNTSTSLVWPVRHSSYIGSEEHYPSSPHRGWKLTRLRLAESTGSQQQHCHTQRHRHLCGEQ